MKELIVTAAQASAAGVKPENDDSIAICIPSGDALVTKGVVAAIADGVSSAVSGGEAAEACVTGFVSDYFATPETWGVRRSAQQILLALNRWLYGQGVSMGRAEHGHVCTLSIAILKGQSVHVFHVGDSRVYRFRDNTLEQLTRDHVTRVNNQQRWLSRAMGLDTSLDVDYQNLPLHVGDILLLTTDGVHDFVELEAIQTLLERSSDLQDSCDELLQRALDNNSNDNVSVQLLRVEELPAQQLEDNRLSGRQLPFPPELEPGMLIDGYRVEQTLHASPRSQLFRVSDLAGGEDLVMKTPSANYVDDAEYRERFSLEAWIGRRMDHPNLMKVKPERQPQTSLYYLAEYLDGVGLDQWMANHKNAGIEERIDLLNQAAKGLQALHRRETFHQDIKPDNLMVDAAGHLTVVDLGACYARGLAEAGKSTLPGQHPVLGTKTYSAPEHKQGQRPAAAADQYSLAVVAYELLTDKLPFNGKLDGCIANSDYARLSWVPAWEHNPHVPVWMDEALERALSVKPEARFGDIAEFLHALKTPIDHNRVDGYVPLAERNPLRFWQAVAGIAVAAELITLWYFLK